jgi:hypothetical protein
MCRMRLLERVTLRDPKSMKMLETTYRLKSLQIEFQTREINMPTFGKVEEIRF